MILIGGFYPVFCISFFYLIIPYMWIKTDEAFHKGQYNKAIEYLSFISFFQPQNVECYVLKAWLQWSQAKYLYSQGLPYEEKLNQAVKTYKKGEKNNPQNWWIYYEEGMMWEAFGEKEKALKAYYISSKYSLTPYNKIYKIKKEKFKMKIEN